jgi:hypothetical protein
VTFTLLETTAFRAPLGIRFFDPVENVPLADGLVVAAWPAGDPTGTLSPVTSPIAPTLVFGNLPGQAAYEDTVAEAGAPVVWPAPPATGDVEVRVSDPVGRFLPLLLSLAVPQGALVTSTLYSAPTRPVPSGFATVSGEVWTVSPPAPAAWAMVDLTAGSATYTTMADQQGRYVIYLPHPEALPPLLGSPPLGSGPLDQITWPVTLQVRYQPSAQRVLADARPTDPPELSTLLAQAAASIAIGGGTQTALAATLTFGVPLQLMLEVLPA